MGDTSRSKHSRPAGTIPLERSQADYEASRPPQAVTVCVGGLLVVLKPQ